MAKNLTVNCKTGKKSYSAMTLEDIEQRIVDVAQNDEVEVEMERREEIQIESLRIAEKSLIDKGEIEALPVVVFK